MRRTLIGSLIPLSFLVLASSAVAQGEAARSAAAAPAGPEVGQLAPDFTAQWADASGARAKPVKLSDLRGKVVVLAFYPLDRSRGCTAELTKFRDEYTTLFGANVEVLPISVDSVATHASWAKEMNFPFALVSDPQLSIAAQYGSGTAGGARASRTVYVIGKDGKVLWREMRFNALAENAYTTLAAEVTKAR
jgi:peroxiredoxin Q/BCP